jgi:hypothetical protein
MSDMIKSTKMAYDNFESLNQIELLGNEFIKIHHLTFFWEQKKKRRIYY